MREARRCVGRPAAGVAGTKSRVGDHPVVCPAKKAYAHAEIFTTGGHRGYTEVHREDRWSQRVAVFMKVREKISLKPPKLGLPLQRAFRYAAEKHAGQTRKQTAVPYLSHLMAVASLVLEAGGDEDTAIAALLHDVVEDCGGMPRLREVRKQFGSRVAKIVEGCTDSFVEPKPEWMERKKNYLCEVKHADAETRLVSAADKLHNVRTILAGYRRDCYSRSKRFFGEKDD